MKIAIMSDLHLGYSDDALPQAKMALEKASEMADCIVAAGDLFDVRVPKQEVVNDGIKLFKNASEAMGAKHPEVKVKKGGRVYENLPVIGIPGTHERRTKGLVNVVDLLDSGGILVNCHNKTTIVEKNSERIAILGMAGVPEEYAADVVKAAKFTLQENCFNIFMFHQTLKEVIPMAPGISLDDLPNGFDLYINGHIHWRRELKTPNKTLLIPGSTVITQMRKNEMEKKGFWLYDTATKTYEFIYIDSRPLYFKEIQVENATADTIKQAVEKAVGEILLQNKDEKHRLPLIKIKLGGSLAKGINSSAIDATILGKTFTAAEVYIDKEFNVVETLKEKIELLRKLKTEEKSVAEIGIAILKEKLKQNKSNLQNEEELFSLLSEGEVEEAIAVVKNSKVVAVV